MKEAIHCLGPYHEETSLESAPRSLEHFWRREPSRRSSGQEPSRGNNDFNVRYPGIVKALVPMPDETIIDGEVVVLDNDGKPSFNALQNYGSAGAPLHFYIFDLLILEGRDVMGQLLVKRRELLEEHVLPKLAEPIRDSQCWRRNWRT
jgi:hypothetical protein